MPLRTAKEYKKALQDSREVYVNGERVKDVTTHPAIKAAVDHSAYDYEVYNDSPFKELALAADEHGKPISRYFKIPRNTEDLLLRNKLIDLSTERNGGVVTFIRAIGSDSIFASMIVASIVDKMAGTQYAKRVTQFLKHCQEKDLSLAGAITDVKGDRSKHPHEQADPDLYLHIVKERDDGIVVRGAKMHTTAAPYVDELIVLPTRAMTASDTEYAVAFAIPVATKGVKLLARPMGSQSPSEFESPLSSKHIHLHSLTVFDDVFVPWERVFLCRETQAAGPLAHYFAIWHRFTGVSYKAPSGDQLIGAAQLIAEYNGVADASHIRNKIADLIAYTECIRAHAKAAALDCKMIEGIAVPNPATINVGKYLFARGFHDAVRNVQDIAGGLTVTVPTEADWESPQTKPFVEKYLKGVADISTEDRIKLFYLIRDLVAGEGSGEHQVVSLHGEGSLEAQRIAAYREYDLEKCKRLVKEWAKIE